MRFSGISGCLSAAVLALGVGGAPVVQADALGDSLEQAHIRKATFAAPAWEGYTNADGSGLYWDLLKQVYAPYGLDVKFINMPWNRANKLMTAGSMVDGVPGEIPGVEGKLYAQLPIDIEYHGVMHAAKTPFSGRASLTGKRVGWRHSYNLIPAEPPAPLNDSRPCVRASFRREVIGCRGHRSPGFHFSVRRPSPFRECPLGFGLPPGSTVSITWIGLWATTSSLCPRASH